MLARSLLSFVAVVVPVTTAGLCIAQDADAPAVVEAEDAIEIDLDDLPVGPPPAGLVKLAAGNFAELRVAATTAAATTTGSEVADDNADEFFGRVGIRALERQLVIEWRAGEADAELSTRRFGVRFWPTAVVAIHPDTLVLAGRDRFGITVFERWRFAVGDASGPSATPDPVAVDEVWSGGNPGESLVRGLWNSPGEQGQREGLVVWFDETRRVYRLDIPSEQFGSWAAPGSEEDVIQVSNLSKHWTGVGVTLANSTQGLIYAFEREVDPPEEGRVAADDRLYLIDSDGDGWLDAFRSWHHADPRHLKFREAADVLEPH